LLENTNGGKPAVLICNKHAFEEDKNAIDEWLTGATLRLLTVNDIYGNYEITFPDKYNG
jgi:hypothetical protein